MQQFTLEITSGLRPNQRGSLRANQPQGAQHMTGVTVPLRQKETGVQLRRLETKVCYLFIHQKESS